MGEYGVAHFAAAFMTLPGKRRSDFTRSGQRGATRGFFDKRLLKHDCVDNDSITLADDSKD